MIFGDFDLGNFRPSLFVVVVVIAIIAQAVMRGKKLLQDSWTDEAWQPRSPGDSEWDSDPVVIRRQTRTAPAPPSAVPAPQPRVGGWEAELEQILRGESVQQRIPPPLPPPPPPPVSSRRAIFDYDSDSDIESAPAPNAPLVSMAESAAAHRSAEQSYAEGATIQEQVTERMRSVSRQVQEHRPTENASQTTQSAESAAVRNWLKQPDTARAAIVAATVFGPPKALEV